MKPTTILQELKQAAEQLGMEVRTEKGNFRGGRCTVAGTPVIMLNKRHMPEVRLRILADALRDAPLDTIYLKPSVRDALEEAWEQLETPPEATHAR
ncbi:hypothetical protein [Salisaeta longa]|uniref:hypothetical protein n=1 Tax=Salisaeta longa TaxID=503170 RepID=UPI0003B3660E|nr:hypothetical protein [Salisaeta longa]